ncbi:MAG TPA: Crp/Fnr family transcriptional regulator [Marinilabiliaceae bacterium]|nr:Crp/Fnr family transcriptional regulator [Marinilabiliaceae bacterium]
MKTIQENDTDFICNINAPCFHMLSEPELSLIKKSNTQVSFRKGENLTKQGTYASYILFILKGVAKQHLEEKDKNYNLKLLIEGDFVGLSTVFEMETYSYSTIALTDTQVMLIEKETIENIIRDNGSFAFNIIHRHCAQSEILYGAIRNLMYKQMNGRMADTLLYLAKEEFVKYDIFTHLTRKDLADFAGISTESAVKIIKSFERDGILQLKDKRIIIVNKDQLKDIAEKG